MNHNTKQGCVYLAKAHHQQMMKDIKAGLWCLAGCNRNNRDYYLAEARKK